MYQIKLRSKAASEIQLAKEYFFFDRVTHWLKQLADEAEHGESHMSGDLDEFLHAINEVERSADDFRKGHWTESFRRFRDATVMDRIRMLLVSLRRREPPWRMAVAVTWFTGILDSLDAEVHVFYEIDHLNRLIIINKFTGLPGQGH
ncbi:hypothetical protein [Neorhodopirellula pilleata]|uniref:Uncharacterized protein n=1 Tax=Neorhodopirellula pilleata TaxID=2714738 RepID=A0A5C5ZSX4_9BACT|nr:hypothetical protein [Neorhodopirellula pilleata]TWT89323.1 hypothetical protein Pla100_56400 [Neorhodopirellula pilleata]